MVMITVVQFVQVILNLICKIDKQVKLNLLIKQRIKNVCNQHITKSNGFFRNTQNDLFHLQFTACWFKHNSFCFLYFYFYLFLCSFELCSKIFIFTKTLLVFSLLRFLFFFFCTTFLNLNFVSKTIFRPHCSFIKNKEVL